MKESNFQIYSTSQEAWDAMFQAILGATKSIYWELYIFLDDEVGRPFFDVLENKAKAGVDVKLTVDSLGSFWLSKKRIQSLREAGVDLRFFHERKKRYRGWWKSLWARTHRKVLVVDEETGFIGGVNIDKKMRDWLDIQVKITGKPVRSLLRAFAKNYLVCGGEKNKIKHLLKYKFRVGQDGIDFVYDEPNKTRSRVRKKYTEALFKARERIILFSPYYFPDKKFLHALWQAKKRGVRIDLLMPFRADIRFMAWVNYFWFSLMRKMGVNIVFSEKMMHGKGVIVDDKWAMIGSSNLNHSSFYDNYEANLHFRNKKSVAILKHRVENWLKDSMEFDEKRWSKRGIWHKFNEWLAVKFYKLLYGNK